LISVLKTINSLFAKVSRPGLVFTGTVLAVVAFFPFAPNTPPFDLPGIGEIAKETIIAPFTFDVEKTPQELERERKEAASKVLLVLDFDREASKRVSARLLALKAALAPASGETKKNAPGTVVKGISETALRTLKKSPRVIDEVLDNTQIAEGNGILGTRIVPVSTGQSDAHDWGPQNPQPQLAYDKDFVTLRKNAFELTVRWADIPVKQAAVEAILGKLKNSATLDAAQLASACELLWAYVAPTIVVNDSETMLRKEKAVQEVLPITGKVLKETELVRSHQVVTADVVEKLYSLRKAQQDMDASGEKMRELMHTVGDLMLILLSLMLAAFYVATIRPEIKREHNKAMALAFILIVQLAVIRLGLFIEARLFENSTNATIPAASYIIPTALASVLTSIFFGVRLSVLMSLFVSVFFGIASGFDYQMFLVALMSGCVAGFVFRDIRYRFDFVKALPPLFLIYGILTLIFEFMGRGFSLIGLMQNWGLALINCIAAVFMAMVLTMVIEHLFDIATNMTLIELSDMNHPILKRLSIEATGTYNHSVLVGNLAESAAERIGANSLFARVASYYHDIGKIERANYFIENMSASEKSRQNKVSPNLSAMIISAHVKEGVDLAQKHKLPRVIRDAIMQHHGTSSIGYLFKKAREQDPHVKVEEDQFCYPGPLPESRENAIIMLADSVEAASRSLAIPSQKLLYDLVKKVIREKFMSAQLDQSNLTLRDLDEIAKGFMPILQGIFHTRDLKAHKA
jgi:putative nucleotidyltransferase with HDIG domain